MATRTGGTNATTSLTGIIWVPSVLAADFAMVANSILDDYNQGTYNAGAPAAVPASPRIYPGAMLQGGASMQLIVPNRGKLIVRPGDGVFVDATGWPILIGANALIAGGTSWSHS